MDPNGCVPSLKGLGVDLSTVKNRSCTCHEEKKGPTVNSRSTVRILIPVGKRVRRRHASAIYAAPKPVLFSEPDVKVELKLRLHPVPKQYLDERL